MWDRMGVSPPPKKYSKSLMKPLKYRRWCDHPGQRDPNINAMILLLTINRSWMVPDWAHGPVSHIFVALQWVWHSLLCEQPYQPCSSVYGNITYCWFTKPLSNFEHQQYQVHVRFPVTPHNVIQRFGFITVKCVRLKGGSLTQYTT